MNSHHIIKSNEGQHQKLDALIQRRRQLAQNFLAPMPGEEALERELLADLCTASAGVTVPPQPLSPEDMRRLSPSHFEALVAVLEARHGSVLLTPYTADGGVDVIAVQPQAIRLIQCKHTSGESLVDADVIKEIKAALDGYRVRWLASLSSQRPLRPALVTNGELTRQGQRAAAEHEVEVITGRPLWRLLAGIPCNYKEILALDGQRLASVRELPEALKKALVPQPSSCEKYPGSATLQRGFRSRAGARRSQGAATGKTARLRH